jgi:ABC-type lipoprotein release transport system permease subunit
MITSISWKNVWRNKSRSLVVIIAVTLGTVAGVFVAGMLNGWVAQRINDVIFTELGHVKIQNPDYLVNEEASHYIANITELEQYLKNSKEVIAYAKRSKIMAMASTARGSSGIMLKGIDIENEKTVSEVYKHLLPGSGSYFEENSRLPLVVISSKTAEQLRLKNYRITNLTTDSLALLNVPQETISKLTTIKEERFITRKKFESAIKGVWSESEIRSYGPHLMTTAAYFQPNAKITFSFTKVNGQIGYLSCRVSGIFKTSNTLFDQTSAFVNHTDLINATGLQPDQFHEVSVILDPSVKDIDPFIKSSSNQFKNLSFLSWKVLAPDAGLMADFIQVYYYLIMGIIFFALAFGIINTMLMAILERVKELGMLMAIGMKRKQVFSMIMLETIFLTLSGSMVGMVLGGLLIKITEHTGLNFSSVAEGFESVGWAATVYPAIDVSFFFGIIFLVVIVAILSSIIPARKALKLKPIEALRTE